MRNQTVSSPFASLPVQHGTPKAERGSCQPTVLVFLLWLVAQALPVGATFDYLTKFQAHP